MDIPISQLGLESALGASFLRRFERSGSLGDLSEAIKIQQRAVQLTPDGQVDLPSWLNNLGFSLSRRFERNGDLADTSEAIKSQQRSVYLAPDGHSNLPIWLSNLGNSVLGRFQRSGDLDDNLGTSFLRRFECSGDLEDLSESIRIQRRAVDFTPDGHADLPSLFNNLGNSCLRRFQRNGDLSEAIRIQERAVHLTPDGCADLSSWLTNLGTLYLCRFERSGDPVDISEAIKNSRHAVRLTPDGHAGLPLCLNSLGLSFLYRFECSGDLEDLSEAIRIQQRGVHLTPDGHADLPMWLSNLGISFSRRFERGRDLEDLSEAIRLPMFNSAQMDILVCRHASTTLESHFQFSTNALETPNFLRRLYQVTVSLLPLLLVARLVVLRLPRNGLSWHERHHSSWMPTPASSNFYPSFPAWRTPFNVVIKPLSTLLNCPLLRAQQPFLLVALTKRWNGSQKVDALSGTKLTSFAHPLTSSVLTTKILRTAFLLLQGNYKTQDHVRNHLLVAQI